MKSIKILVAFAIFALCACGGNSSKTTQTETDKVPNGWKTLEQKEYSIIYPSTWEIDQSGRMGSNLILFAPSESSNASFRENVNLVTEDLPTGMDLDQYVTVSENQLKTALTNFVLIESERVKEDSKSDDYTKLIYDIDQGAFKLRFMQCFRVVNKRAYILTFTAERDKFSDLEETAERILNSFKVK